MITFSRVAQAHSVEWNPQNWKVSIKGLNQHRDFLKEILNSQNHVFQVTKCDFITDREKFML